MAAFSRCAHVWVWSFLAATCAVAQVSRLEGEPVTDIQITPAQALDPEDLKKAIGIQRGERFRADRVAAAIDGLFATGRFADIVAEAEPAAGGVLLRFVTTPMLFVGGIEVAGKVVSPPNRAQIAATADLNLGAPFHDADLTQAVDQIKSVLRANGLYEAEVTTQVRQGPVAQQIFITFQIHDHKRAKYEMPAIHAAPEVQEASDGTKGSADRAAPAIPAAGNGGGLILSDGAIVHATGWRLPVIHWWRQVTDQRTHKGVQGVVAKYQSKGRLTAKVELENLDYDAKRRRVRPTLAVNPGPEVKVTSEETKVSQRVLKKYVPVFEEHSVNNDLLAEGKRNLTDYFQSQGYYDVTVDIRSHPPANDVETIQYVISRGTRYKLVRISFTGNTYFREDDLRDRMFMEPASFSLRHGRYSEAFRRKDEQNLAELYRANGFRDVKVSSVTDRNYQGKAGEVGVTVHIEEGGQWLVETVTLNGFTQFSSGDLAKRLASSPGQPFAEVNLASDRNTLLTRYYAAGFPDADLAIAWEPVGPNRVRVTYTITEGERKFVRGVVTSGLHTTKQRLVDKYITLKPGDPLSPIEQTNIQKRFYNLGIFARADTAIENPDGDTDRKYILYNFEEANRYILGVGFGAQVGRFGTPSTTSLSAPAGSTGFSPQGSLDLTRINLFGIGQTASLHALASTLEKRASINYLIPRLGDVQGRDLTFTVLYDNSLNVNTFASRREEASVQLSNRFSKALTGSFLLTYRRVSVSSVEIPVLLIPELLAPVRLGMVSATFVHDRRDDKADPHRGMFNTADLGLAGKFLGSERSFGRVLVRNATYHPLRRHLVLARQTQFGVIAPFAAPAGLTAQASVPLPERFFGGGADSLRAFPFNQAGPRDTGAPVVPGGPSSEPTGFPLGGNALFFNNVELRFPFIGPNIQGVLFHDMGNVFSTLGNMSFRFHQKDLQDFDYTVHAAGFGIRYRTPVGPIRVDLAYSINPPSFVGFNGTPEQLLQCNPNLPPQGPCVGVKQNVSHFQFFFSIGQTF